MTEAEIVKTMKTLRFVARFMDNGWGIPLTRLRFGADSIIGLLPGGGDLLTATVSLFIVWKAHEMGASRQLILKMLGNVALDTGLGSIPVVGDIFDMLFMSNIKNMDLLAEFMRKKGYAV